MVSYLGLSGLPAARFKPLPHFPAALRLWRDVLTADSALEKLRAVAYLFVSVQLGEARPLPPCRLNDPPRRDKLPIEPDPRLGGTRTALAAGKKSSHRPRANNRTSGKRDAVREISAFKTASLPGTTIKHWFVIIFKFKNAIKNFVGRPKIVAKMQAARRPQVGLGERERKGMEPQNSFFKNDVNMSAFIYTKWLILMRRNYRLF